MTQEYAFKNFPKDRHKKLDGKKMLVNADMEDFEVDSDSRQSEEQFTPGNDNICKHTVIQLQTYSYSKVSKMIKRRVPSLSDISRSKTTDFPTIFTSDNRVR